MSCVFDFDAKNELTGEVSLSLLWDGLKKLGHGHSFAKMYYGIATDSEFQKLAKDKLSYILEGEPTLESFLDAIKEDYNKEAMREIVLKQLGDSKPMSFSKAIYMILAYNKYNPNSLFLASFKQAEGNQVIITVEDNNSVNEANLLSLIKKMSLIDRMMWYLRQAGVDVKYVLDDNIIYNVLNAEENSEALRELILLSKSDETSVVAIREDLTETAAHFILGVLGEDHPLVSRLYNTLEKNNIPLILIEEDARSAELDDIKLGDRFSNLGDTRSIAAYLIGRQLNNSADKTKSLPKVLKWLSNLLNRIIDYAKVKLKKIPSMEYAVAMREVNDIALLIAKGFTSPTFTGYSKNTIELEVFLKDSQRETNLANATTNVRVVSLVFKLLNNFVNELRNYDTKLYKLLKTALNDAESVIDYSKFDDTIMQENSMLALANGLRVLLGNYINIDTKLKNINFANEVDFVPNMGKHANTIFVSLQYVNSITLILDYLQLFVPLERNKPEETLNDTEVEIPGPYGSAPIKINIKDLVQNLRELLYGTSSTGGLLDRVTSARRLYVKRFVSEIIGATLILHADRILGFTAKETRGKLESIDTILDSLGEDISWWNRWFTSMSNNPDIIGQAFDKIVKVSKMRANAKFLETRNELLIVLLEAKRKGINLERLYDRDDNGELTSYLKSYITLDTGEEVGVDYAKWELDFEDMKEAAKLDFYKIYDRHKLRHMTSIERAVLWEKFFNKKYKNWHKENTTTIVRKKNGEVIGRERIPNLKKYHSDKYEKLTPEEKNTLKEYMKIKSKLDENLPQGSTLAFRTPQLYGSFTNLLLNRRLIGESVPKAFFNTLMQEINDAVTLNRNDIDYGSDRTVNTMEEYLGRDSYMEDKIERVPLFYINKIPKEKRAKMSTDLIGSTLAYAAMANQYKYLSSIKDALSLTKELMKARLHNGEADNGTTNAYKRIESYLDKELFGLTYKTRNNPVQAWIAKMMQLSSALASRMFLGGNVQGAIANWLMGVSETTKEVATGEYFTMSDYKEAIKSYFAWDEDNESYNFFEDNMFVDSFRQVKKNKVNLFAEHFNVFGDNDREFRNYNFRLQNIFGKNTNLEVLKKVDIFWNNAFAPYSAGDHFMLVIPFMSLAKHTKLYYNKNGILHETNVYDAYKIIHGEKTNEIGVFGIQGEYFKSKQGAKTVAELKDKIVKINNFISDLESFTSSLGKGFSFGVWDTNKYKNLTEELALKDVVAEADSITNKNIVNELQNYRKKLELQIHDLTWQIEDESDFRNKAREIANRLHGIYNQADKTEIQQYVLGASILAMRGYALGMIERRFGTNKYSLALGKDVEGSEVTPWKVFASIFRNRLSFTQMMAIGWLPYIRPAYVKETMLQAGFSENLYFNMRRHFADWAIILICSALTGGFFRMFGMNGLIGKSDDDDSDDFYPKNENDFGTALAYYFLTRLYMESAAYNEIAAFSQQEGPSTFSLMGSNVAMLSNILKIANLMIEGEEYEKGEWKGQSKAFIATMKYVPYFRWYYSVGHDPRKATEAFEINRGSYGRH